MYFEHCTSFGIFMFCRLSVLGMFKKWYVLSYTTLRSQFYTPIIHIFTANSLPENFASKFHKPSNFTFTVCLNRYVLYDYGVCSMAIFLTHHVNLELDGGIDQPTEWLRYLHTLLLFDCNGNQKI